MTKIAVLRTIRVLNVVRILHGRVRRIRGVCSVVDEALGVAVVEVERKAVLKPLIERELQSMVGRTAGVLPESYSAEIGVYACSQCPVEQIDITRSELIPVTRPDIRGLKCHIGRNGALHAQIPGSGSLVSAVRIDQA